MLGKSIGIVEDEREAAEVVQQYIAEEFELQSHVYIVKTKDDLTKAYEGIRDNLDNVVMIDINLQAVSGYDLLDLLNKNPDTQQVWKVMVSSDVFAQKRRQSRMRGADDILEKPYNFEDMRLVLDHGLMRFDQIQSHTSTGLPGANRLTQIEKQIQAVRIPWAFVSIDWNGLGSLNRKGERVADEALRKFGGILRSVTEREPIGLRYVGQLGKSDNTFFICSAENAIPLVRDVSLRFRASTSQIYDQQELDQGYMEAIVVEPNERGDPEEKVRKYPLCSLAFGVNSNFYFDGNCSFAVDDLTQNCRPSTRQRPMPFSWLVRDLSVRARDDAKLVGKRVNKSWVTVHDQSPLSGLTKSQYEEAMRR